MPTVSRMQRKFQQSMVVARFSYNGNLKLRRVEKNIKINLSYYHRNVLRFIFTEEIPFFISTYFKQWNCTKAKPAFILGKLSCTHWKTENDTDITYINFRHIFEKFPYVSGIIAPLLCWMSSFLVQAPYHWWTLENIVKERRQAIPRKF